jgi:spoIIIJ-associated protein
VEWVETTGRTVAEAKKSALEQLGVAESDAEFQVVSEPKFGLFGRLKEEARVRARVQPRYPRSKGERRERRRNRGPAGADHKPQTGSPGYQSGSGDDASDNAQHPTDDGRKADDSGSPAAGQPGGGRRRRQTGAPAAKPGREGANFSEVKTASTEEQVQLAEEFLHGLLAELGSTATVSSHDLADGVVELLIDGENLGTLIGPKGATLLALQELTRTVLQHRVGPSECRVVVDVNGYRKRRQEALTRFAQQVAAEVQASNTKRALEPMPPADRKVVHDAVNSVAGVTTISEGEEPYRRVVLVPEQPEEAPEQGTVVEEGSADSSQEQSESVGS